MECGDEHGSCVAGQECPADAVAAACDEAPAPAAATLVYAVAGPAGCGELVAYSEEVDARDGEPKGSLPLPGLGFRFAGWYCDESCKTPVAKGVNGMTGRLVPQRPSGEQGPMAWEDACYWACFEAASSCLCIKKTLSAPAACDEVYVYSVLDAWGDAATVVDLTVPAGEVASTAVAKGLDPGRYTVVENGSWAWHEASVLSDLASPVLSKPKVLDF